MSRSKRSTSKEDERTEQWLGPAETLRSRPWAYEELLHGADGTHSASEELRSLAADLTVDLAELKRMQAELHDEVVRVASLEGWLRALLRSTEEERVPLDTAEEPTVATELRSFPSGESRSIGASERERALTRCEGFRVESSSGLVGYVEGLRFQSRIDQPDLLEVRGGRFGRELMLIPVEAVDDVSVEEELVVVHGVPAIEGDHLHELMDRVRRVLSVHNTTLGGVPADEDTLT